MHFNTVESPSRMSIRFWHCCQSWNRKI